MESFNSIFGKSETPKKKKAKPLDSKKEPLDSKKNELESKTIKLDSKKLPTSPKIIHENLSYGLSKLEILRLITMWIDSHTRAKKFKRGSLEHEFYLKMFAAKNKILADLGSELQ
ncbi:hypothetical protein [Candidatus Lokiarchaeum ossiferum]|uniref:hypothetical protein n=1 Tax=Candidatus Lokiarchaeum ossiferum TaxID=2951803 RepID=UPI00352E67BC